MASIDELTNTVEEAIRTLAEKAARSSSSDASLDSYSKTTTTTA